MEEHDLADVFAALADPTRLRLLRFLLDGEHCVTECTEHLELTQGAVSKHLARLDSAGLLRRRRDGRRTYQQVAAPECLATLLAQAAALPVPNNESPTCLTARDDPAARVQRPGVPA